MKQFALIGASGYIAPRHLKAIKETNSNLITALDPFDSVGVMDSYFPNADFFTEFERFDRYVSKLRFDKAIHLDYVSICTPNYLHDSHIRFALRHGADAICEKPLVLNPWNLDSLSKIEEISGRKIYNILQLREHKTIIDLKKKIDSSDPNKIYDIDLTYLTSRGNWYYTSWKGDKTKSGGIATNIGVHFFDMLNWIFGDLISNIVHIHTHDRAAGFLEFKRARVRWFLSINEDLIPPQIKSTGQRTYRSIKIDGKDLEFSDGFTDLHTTVYRKIISGNGYGLSEARPAIEIVSQIRTMKPVGLNGSYHNFAKKSLSNHPFENTK